MLCLWLVRLTPYFFASAIRDRRYAFSRGIRIMNGIRIMKLRFLSGSLLERNDLDCSRLNRHEKEMPVVE